MKNETKIRQILEKKNFFINIAPDLAGQFDCTITFDLDGVSQVESFKLVTLADMGKLFDKMDDKVEKEKV